MHVRVNQSGQGEGGHGIKKESLSKALMQTKVGGNRNSGSAADLMRVNRPVGYHQSGIVNQLGRLSRGLIKTFL
jgi:hypothetical protein